MTEQMIDTRVGRLKVTVLGDRGPTALLWHSLFVDERSWNGMLPILADRRRLVVHRARSWSEYRSRPAIHPANALNQHWSPRRAGPSASRWTGWATPGGGHVGLIFAAEARAVSERSRVRHTGRRSEPQRTEKDPAPSGSVSAARRIADDRGRDDRRAVVAAHDRARPRRRRSGPRLPLSRRSADAAQRDRLDLDAPSRPGGHAQGVSRPVLIVTGDDHHGFTPDQAREAVSMIARGQLAILPDTAYLTPHEAPAACADLVLALWAGCKRR